MKYAIMICFLHQIIVTSDSFNHIEKERKRLQEINIHYDYYRGLQEYIHDTYAFKIMHNQYEMGIKKYGLASKEEQEQLNSLFKLHMQREFLHLQEWKKTIAERTNFEYDFEPFGFSIGVGCYFLAYYMYHYCNKHNLDHTSSLLQACIPLVIILGNLALYDAVNHSKSIHGRIKNLDENYKIAFPSVKEPLSVLAKPVKKIQHVYYQLPLLP